MTLLNFLEIIPNGQKYSITKCCETALTRNMERVVEGSSPRRHCLKNIIGTEEELWITRAGVKLTDEITMILFGTIIDIVVKE